MISKELQATLSQWAEELAEQGETLGEKASSLKAPQWMAARARQGLALRDKQPSSNKAGTPVGLKRANQLINGDNLSLSTIKRMKAYAERSGSQPAPNENSKSKGAWLLWGWDKGELSKYIAWCDQAIAKLQ